MDRRYNLNRLAYFVAVVEARTITAAAEQLGLSKAVVSKHLQLLEEEVGVSLLVRNTRRMQPTHAGQAFYESSKALLIQAEAAFETVLERAKVPSGRLRITAPVDFGVSHVAPLVARTCDLYPRLQIELVLSDEQVDIVDERYDLAFRVGWLKDSSNRARKLSRFKEIVVCSPALAAKNSIKAPEDLASLPYIAHAALGNDTKWQFRRGKETRSVDLHATMTMNVTLAACEAVKAGSGITILPDFLVEKDIANQEMVTLLPKWSLREGGVYALSPPSRLRTSAAQTFLDMAKQDMF